MTGIRRPGDEPVRSRSGGDDDLDRWVAELRADAAGTERARRRMLARASNEEATVRSAIIDLAERGEPVVLELEGDRSRRGVIRLVGRDVLVLRDHRTETIIQLAAVASIRLRPEQPTRQGQIGPGSPRSQPALSPRRADDGTTVDFARVLAALADAEPEVTVHRRGVRSPLSGVLTSVGLDVAVVHTAQTGTSYVPLSSVVEVSLTGSG